MPAVWITSKSLLKASTSLLMLLSPWSRLLRSRATALSCCCTRWSKCVSWWPASLVRWATPLSRCRRTIRKPDAWSILVARRQGGVSRSCCAGKRVLVKNCWVKPSTMKASAPAGRISPWTVSCMPTAYWGRILWAVRPPTMKMAGWAVLNWRTAARCFWKKLNIWHRSCNPRCYRWLSREY